MNKNIVLILIFIPFILFIFLSTSSDINDFIDIFSGEITPNLAHLKGSQIQDPISNGHYVNGLAGPVQINSDSPVIEKTVGNSLFLLTPRAKYRIHAQVAGKRLYSGSDNDRLAPVDFALIWGSLTTPEVKPYLSFSMPTRQAYYNCKSGCPVSISYINSHMSNNHIIAADDSIEKRLMDVQVGDVLNMSGYLVNVFSKKDRQTFHWRTSLSRTDSGMGACEVFYVEDFSTIPFRGT
jgi:hypothetical protein